MWKLLAVCLGGALGSGARYLVSVLALRFFGASFPWGTFAVNIVGSVVLGVLAHAFEREGALSVELRLLLTAGFCGGFTTYSTFNLEALRMLEDGRAGLALGYMAATFVVCLAAGYVAWLVARTLW